MSHINTLDQIADIISFNSDTDRLRQSILNNTLNWEEIVRLASHHLVLTTVYYRLKQKLLLDIIPPELNNYLYEISSINRNRNHALLKEIHYISELFYNLSSSHVFF